MRLLSHNGKGYYLNQIIYEWNRSEIGMNRRVPLEVWTKVHIANMDFYDMAGEGIEARKKVMWSAMHLRDLCLAQKIARELLRLRAISFSIVAIALFSPKLTHLLYHVARGIRRLWAVARRCHMSCL
jgi:hypothetical protein